MISTPLIPTPPAKYGGLELVVYNLACGLTELGHKVVVFATSGSKVPPNGFLYECIEPAMKVEVNWMKLEREMWKVYDPLLEEFDIINSHDWFSFAYASKAKNPSLKVAHCHHGWYNKWWIRSKPPFKLNLIAISDWMARENAPGFKQRRVYNGIALEDYPFKAEHGERLLYVGRFTKFKGAHVALEVAERTGLGLDLLGGATFISREDKAYYEAIRNRCDGERFKIYPDASHEVKVELMQNAKAILVPSNFGEPFCLVPPEANATGCPVIAFDDGGLKEVVEDGVSGFIVPKSAVAMADAIKKIDEIKPEACRQRVERLFTRKVMAKNYLACYEDILSNREW